MITPFDEKHFSAKPGDSSIMTEQLQQYITRSITRIMRPFAEILIRNNVPFKVFADISKKAYIEAARKVLALPGKKLSLSRISVVTGIPRKEINKYLNTPLPADDDITAEHNRAARVITGWIKDEDFIEDVTGHPRDLPLEGEGPTLSKLIQKYSGGIPTKALLDELLRIEAVRDLGGDVYRLISKGYLPNSDQSKQMDNIGIEVSDLLKAINHNTVHPQDESYLQLSVRCDNLPEEVMDKLQKLTSERGQQYLQDIAKWISNYDRDQNDKVFGTGKKRVGIGLYYFEEDADGQHRAGEKT